jgi:hypothetical protein
VFQETQMVWDKIYKLLVLRDVLNVTVWLGRDWKYATGPLAAACAAITGLTRRVENMRLKLYSVFILVLSWTLQLLWVDLPDGGFLCNKAVMPSVAIKERPCLWTTFSHLHSYLMIMLNWWYTVKLRQIT